MAARPTEHHSAARRCGNPGHRLRATARAPAGARNRRQDPRARLHPLGHRRQTRKHRRRAHRGRAAPRTDRVRQQRIALAELLQRPPLPATATQPHGLRRRLRRCPETTARRDFRRPLRRRRHLVLRQYCGRQTASAHPVARQTDRTAHAARHHRRPRFSGGSRLCSAARPENDGRPSQAAAQHQPAARHDRIRNPADGIAP